MEFRVLDQVKAFDDNGTPIKLSANLQVLLAVLLINQGTEVSKERLKSYLWDDKPRTQATLDGCITELRSVLSSTFGTRAGLLPAGLGYLQLTLDDPTSVDHRRFHDHMAAADNAEDDVAAIVALGDAIAEFRGEPLGALNGVRLSDLRTDLDGQHRGACHGRARRMVKLGMHAEVLTELNKRRHRWPSDEHLFMLWVDALVANGRQADVRAAFDRFDRAYKATTQLREYVDAKLITSRRGNLDATRHAPGKDFSSSRPFETQRCASEIGKELANQEQVPVDSFGIEPNSSRDRLPARRIWATVFIAVILLSVLFVPGSRPSESGKVLSGSPQAGPTDSNVRDPRASRVGEETTSSNSVVNSGTRTLVVNDQGDLENGSFLSSVPRYDIIYQGYALGYYDIKANSEEGRYLVSVTDPPDVGKCVREFSRSRSIDIKFASVQTGPPPWVCVQTRSGKMAAVQVVRPPRDKDDTMEIRFVVWPS